MECRRRVRCGLCGAVVRDKWLLGTLHICLSDEEIELLSASPVTKRQHNQGSRNQDDG